MPSVLEPDELAAVAHDRTAFNLAVWDKVVGNPEFQAMPWRFETDEHGQIIMSPSPAPEHSDLQFRMATLIERHAPAGKVLTECSISTPGGVRAADIAWCSIAVWNDSAGKSCLVRAPEICLEILSPSNTKAEIGDKRDLYFAAGATEVWIRTLDGSVQFFTPDGPIVSSLLCPGFPGHVS